MQTAFAASAAGALSYGAFCTKFPASLPQSNSVKFHADKTVNISLCLGAECTPE